MMWFAEKEDTFTFLALSLDRITANKLHSARRGWAINRPSRQK